MVVLDIRNSRMKDFYDIWFMANTWNFEMATLRDAIHASFERRGVRIPQDIPFALTEEFLGDPQKTRQWNAFVGRLHPGSASPSPEDVGALLRAFLLPRCRRLNQLPTIGLRAFTGTNSNELQQRSGCVCVAIFPADSRDKVLRRW
jgi:hypothetical protein